METPSYFMGQSTRACFLASPSPAHGTATRTKPLRISPPQRLRQRQLPGSGNPPAALDSPPTLREPLRRTWATENQDFEPA